jgi:hypothetical protein
VEWILSFLCERVYVVVVITEIRLGLLKGFLPNPRPEKRDA